ncbi:MAG: glycosyltransferase family 4 protein [Patescibacteria group bacterium]|nr:glycosyltransferase family 4 protein [Patescibacteria group bacterium]
MKIVYLSSSAIPSQTANSVQVMKMCHGFAGIGHTVWLLTPWVIGNDRERLLCSRDIFKYYNVASNFRVSWMNVANIRGKPLYLIPKIIRQLRSIKPDIVYGRFLLGCVAAALAGWPSVYEAHCPVWEINPIERLAFTLLLQLPAFKRCIFISEILRTIYVQRFPSHDGKFVVAHDAADVPQYSQTKRPSTSIVTGYVGSLGEGKGVEIVVGLARKNPDIRFIIAGGTENQKESLQKRVPPNIELVGFVSQSDICEVYNRFEVALLPNQLYMPSYGSKINIADYNSPLKLFEYMAHSKAMISSDLPNIREILSEETAILVKPSDILAWSKALNELRNPDVRQRLKDAAFRQLMYNHTWQKRAELVLNDLEWCR